MANRSSLKWTAACIMLCCAARSVAAQEGAVVELSLDECLRMALANNLQLVSATYGPEFALQDIETQKAAFDAGLESAYTHSESQSATTQLSSVTGNKQDRVTVGVAQLLDFGASYNAGFGITKADQTGPNVVAPTQYYSGVDLTFNMPLLKGLGSETATEALVLARNNLDISRAELERQAELIMEQVEGAYWDVVAAREALRIARLSLDRAQDLLELNRKKVEVGTLAPIEITQAEAGVASQEEGVIVAEAQLGDARDELLRLLAIPREDPRWQSEIVNSTRPVFEKQDIDVDAAIEQAMASRPDVATAEQTLTSRELSERVARRNTRHQLDFNATWSPTGASLDFAGFAGSPGPPPIPPIPPHTGSLSESLSNIFNGDVYSWSAGLVYRVPFGNNAAQATYARARIGREQAETDLSNTEQTVRVDVRRTARAVDSGIKRVDAARKNVELQQKKLEAEQKKFENGMSTSFEVLTFQNDLASAELSEIRARLDYIKALAAFERAKGTLLEARGLRLEG